MTLPKGIIERTADRFMPSFLRPSWDRLRMSSIGYRLAHGAFWSTMGAGMSQALMLLISIIAARILGKEQFGQYGIIISTVGMFSIFAGFGLGTTATKFVAEYKHSDSARAGRIIALSTLVAGGTGILASALLLVIAPWLSAHTLAAPHLSNLLRLAVGIILFGALNSSQIGVLSGFEAFRGIAVINLISGVMSFLFVTAGILASGIAGALVGQTVAAGIACLVTSIALRNEARRCAVPLCFIGCYVEHPLLLSFTLPAVLSGILVSPVTWACSAILVNQPDGYAEMGIFNAAISWQKAILFLPSCLGAIALPMLSSLNSTSERVRYQKALHYNVLLGGTAALAVALVVVMFSKMIMRSYGTSFETGYNVLILLSLSSILIAIGSVIGNAIASAGKMWFAFIFNGMWGITYVAIAFVLIPKYGAVGLATSNILTYLIHSCWQLWYLKKL